jgi:hypothetical protein
MLWTSLIASPWITSQRPCPIRGVSMYWNVLYQELKNEHVSNLLHISLLSRFIPLEATEYEPYQGHRAVQQGILTDLVLL